jgi:hypothetical protein
MCGSTWEIDVPGEIDSEVLSVSKAEVEFILTSAERYAPPPFFRSGGYWGE